MKKLIMFFLLIIGTLAYSFQIDDITFDAQVGGNGYREYRIYNDSLKKQIYKVNLEGKGDIDITKDMSWYPKVLAVEPQSYAVLKIYGGDKTDAPRGVYTFKLSFSPVVLPKLPGQINEGEITGTSTVGVIPEIEMSAYVGNREWEKALDIENFSEYKDKDGKLHIVFETVNKGDVPITAGIRMATKGDNITTSTFVGRLLPGQRVKKDIEVNMFTKLEDIYSVQLYNTSLGIVYIDKNLKTKEKIGGRKL